MPRALIIVLVCIAACVLICAGCVFLLARAEMNMFGNMLSESLSMPQAEVVQAKDTPKGLVLTVEVENPSSKAATGSAITRLSVEGHMAKKMPAVPTLAPGTRTELNVNYPGFHPKKNRALAFHLAFLLGSSSKVGSASETSSIVVGAPRETEGNNYGPSSAR